ncbi:methylated-DNA--[protein]-cysteine S-methyltransferase [Planomicrobium sp. CPCC 101110]|uniref:methylated-DNA--[protein]-cysteine S-methyltransferase n=1 Tax=Planomicrobium sp. CPCC 101110 TaxID=2599619 RepID=UPI0011B66016|nr:methylated-DNA--[protein]-cysteine S-methyltransferase [Planomicrobium sp. CPCC 101110]TWT24826.1 methylated-DNA--[protein]-cysteine S-methyltransferase [Planomicrobium sp. CPCC 101110]
MVNPNEQTIEWTVLKHGQWELYVAKTNKGLCYIGSPGSSFDEFKVYFSKRYPDFTLAENPEALTPYVQELVNYFSGTKQAFSLPIDVKGTPFQEEIWRALQTIPYGETVSYSEIAALINRPSAARAVGSAIGANPLLILVPCHRVIGKNGAITGYRGGMDLKRFLLDLELQKT